MYFVQCPRCGDPIEIPASVVGSERTDPWNVVGCDECGLTFDYDDAEVQHSEDIHGVL